MTSATTDRRIGLTGGAALKTPCLTVSTGPITANGLQTINGVVLVAGDRVLRKDETDATQNGIWVADTGAWSRDLDFDADGDCVYGTIVPVLRPNGLIFYWLTTTTPIIGTSVLNFSLLPYPATILSSAVTHTYPEAPQYLKVLSDIENGDELSLFRFCTQAQINDITASTVSVDISTALNIAVNACQVPQRAATLIIPGRCWINGTSYIDRLVDNTYSEFKIIGRGPGAGFYTTGDITIFDSTIAATTAPVSEFVTFEGLQFESSAATNNSYILTQKFLRIKNRDCYFKRIRYINCTSIYAQTFHFIDCNIRNCGYASKPFFVAYGSYDLSFIHNIIENNYTLVKSVDPAVGTNELRIIDNVIEGSQESTLLLTGCANLVFSINYVEANPINDINLFAGGVNNLNATFQGNLFVNPNGEVVYYGPIEQVNSIGNTTTGAFPFHSNAVQITNLTSIGDKCPLNAGVPYIADVAMIKLSGNIYSNQPLSLCNELGAAQAFRVYQGSGAPSGAAGNNGDVYLRGDTPATGNQRIYNKQAGVWTGIV